MIAIALRLVGADVAIKPAGYLSHDFATFRACIEGVRFDGVTKANLVPVAKALPIVARLREAGFPLDVAPEVAALLRESHATSAALTSAASTRLEAAEAILTERGLSLYPFQRTGVAWLATRTSALLADEMGLGKSIQTLVAIPEDAAVIVVAPAVAKGVWARECKKWRPELRVTVLAGRNSFRWPERGEVVILNYDILPAQEAFAVPADVTLIADEAHALKSWKAQRTKRFSALSTAVRAAGGRCWCLTATPLLNRPPELWAVLSAAGCEREVFGSYKQFFALFGGVKDKWGGVKWSGVDGSVPARVGRASLRRMRAAVLPDLPGKTWEELPVEIDRATLKLCDALVEKLSKDGLTLDVIEERITRGAIGFEEFSLVRAALATAKIPAMLSVIESYEEQEEPLLVFSAHRAPIDLLATREGWATITGSTSPEEKTAIEESFQRGELKGLGLTIQAGGVAITLTHAAHELFVDRHWTPALNTQAEDRASRIGQTRGVLVKSLTANHALDQMVIRACTVKSRMVRAALPTGEAPAAEVFDVEALLAQLDEDGTYPHEGETCPAERGMPSDEFFGGREEWNDAPVTSYGIRSSYPSPPPVPPSAGAPSRFTSFVGGRSPAVTAAQQWAREALLTLSGLDADRATERNDVGFNKLDGDFGASLAFQLREKGLTGKQWDAAFRLLKKYHRQIGRCPE